MKNWNRREVLGVGVASALPAIEAAAKPASPAMKKEIAASAEKGVRFLKQAQDTDGSWQHYPGITALCLLGLIRSGLTVKDPAVRLACDLLLSQAPPDGGIYTEALGPAQVQPNFFFFFLFFVFVVVF